MIQAKLISTEELKRYGKIDNFADKAKSLLGHQKENWSLCGKNYSDLNNVEVKSFDFDNFSVKVQFNPGRIVSSSAKVDSKSIAERKCFLCPANLPDEQKAILFNSSYAILVNPFPIFHEHFTLPRIDHLQQNIIDNFESMLDYSKELGKYYTVFYNGPKCGASAPDHMHYQAGNKGFMPIDAEYELIISKSGTVVFEENDLKIYSVENYLRRFLSIESTSRERIIVFFEKFYSIYEKISHEEEPMMNIISSYEEGKWRVIIFPRQKHRPSQYFSEGDGKILLSPASVDLGGVCITPREEDFKKITADDIIDIYRQVGATKEYFEYFIKEIMS